MAYSFRLIAWHAVAPRLLDHLIPLLFAGTKKAPPSGSAFSVGAGLFRMHHFFRFDQFVKLFARKKTEFNRGFAQ